MESINTCVNVVNVEEKANPYDHNIEGHPLRIGDLVGYRLGGDVYPKGKITKMTKCTITDEENNVYRIDHRCCSSHMRWYLQGHKFASMVLNPVYTLDRHF